MPQLVYRDASLNDLPDIVDIYNSTIASRMVTADIEPVTVESRVIWFEQHAPKKRPLLVIEYENKKIVGWVSFQSFYGRPAYNATVEIGIYLHPEERGKGLGQPVLQHCMDEAPNYGISTLLGFIFAHNTASIRLFYKLGFEEWGMLPNVANLDGMERSLKILGKRIA
ncbi:MAG: N-acetyltransferase family protein [Bacteroidota bacterium]|nr:N-acetyltransferase family protein [Bacteroidota bacterium]